MKKSLVILLVIIVLTAALTCCRTESDEAHDPLGILDKPEVSAGPYEGVIRILYPSLVKRDTEQEQQHINDWEKYMKDIYGLNIDMLYTMRVDQDYSIRDENYNRIIIDQVADNSNEGGFVYINQYMDLLDLQGKGLVQPVDDDIFEMYGVRNINKRLLENFTDSEGQVWAVPLDEQSYVSARIYDRTWLESAGMGIPETVDEFYEYARYVRSGDPDRDGKKNTYITWYDYSQLATDFSDIYKAFGCYEGSNQNTIAYNPITGKYGIAAFSENFEELMMFIKQLKDEFLIIKANYNTRNDYENKDFKIASCREITVIDYDSADYSYYLKGINENNLIKLGCSGALAVLEGTADVSQKLSAMYSVLSDSSEIRYDLGYGIKGIDYFDKGDHYEIYSTRTHPEMLTRIGIGTNFNDIAHIKKPVIMENYYSVEESISRRNVWFTIKNESNSLQDPALYYCCPFYMCHPQLEMLSRETMGHVYRLYEDILTDGMPVDEAVDYLMFELEKAGVLDALDAINGE